MGSEMCIRDRADVESYGFGKIWVACKELFLDDTLFSQENPTISVNFAGIIHLHGQNRNI